MRVMRVLSTAAVPVLLFGWLTWSERSLEHRLQPIASKIAGHEISVDCQSFLGSLVDVESREGEVRFDASGPARAAHLPHTLDASG
jgi:hypothetical protein